MVVTLTATEKLQDRIDGVKRRKEHGIIRDISYIFVGETMQKQIHI